VTDDLDDARKQQEEIEERLSAIFEQAGESLKMRIAEDSELRKLAYMILFSNRLFNWALSEVSSLKNISNEMVQVLLKAQQEKAQEIFDFAEMVEDFQSRQLPWLESRRREAVAKKSMRERRIAEMVKRNRKKNIGLPCHSMEVLFGHNFTHKDILVVVGERRAVLPTLQLCAARHTKAGGRTVLLSSNELARPAPHLAENVVPPQLWRNATTIYADLRDLLSPFSKGINPMGLLVVEDLDNMLMQATVAQPRPVYLRRSFALLQQYQLEFGGAMILGVLTDNDPIGLDRIQMYPPELLAKHVPVSWQESKISNIPSILVGNDLMLLSDYKETVVPE
jgi:hypothetical protein